MYKLYNAGAQNVNSEDEIMYSRHIPVDKSAGICYNCTIELTQ